MIDPSHIKKILEINGINSQAPEDTIRSVLLSARYNKDEIDTALLVLRENLETKKVRVEGLHKVFRTSHALAPKEISKLLGIEVDVSRFEGKAAQKKAVSRWEYFIVWLLSIVLAIVGTDMFMHMNKVGLFHPSVALSDKPLQLGQ